MNHHTTILKAGFLATLFPETLGQRLPEDMEDALNIGVDNTRGLCTCICVSPKVKVIKDIQSVQCPCWCFSTGYVLWGTASCTCWAWANGCHWEFPTNRRPLNLTIKLVSFLFSLQISCVRWSWWLSCHWNLLPAKYAGSKSVRADTESVFVKVKTTFYSEFNQQLPSIF